MGENGEMKSDKYMHCMGNACTRSFDIGFTNMPETVFLVVCDPSMNEL
jgi:hypothetical protein